MKSKKINLIITNPEALEAAEEIYSKVMTDIWINRQLEQLKAKNKELKG